MSALPAVRPGDVTWQDRSQCTGSGYDFTDTTRPTEVAEMRKICAECPVSTRCLDWIMSVETGTRYGFYAGLMPSERNGLAKVMRLDGELRPAEALTRLSSVPKPKTSDGRRKAKNLTEARRRARVKAAAAAEQPVMPKMEVPPPWEPRPWQGPDQGPAQEPEGGLTRGEWALLEFAGLLAEAKEELKALYRASHPA